MSQRQTIHLIRYAKALGHVISVYDGGEWAVKKSTNEKEIMEAIDSVDESNLIIRDAAGNKVASALIVLGNDPDEEVADCSDNLFMNAWTRSYNADSGVPA